MPRAGALVSTDHSTSVAAFATKPAPTAGQSLKHRVGLPFDPGRLSATHEHWIPTGRFRNSPQADAGVFCHGPDAFGLGSTGVRFSVVGAERHHRRPISRRTSHATQPRI